MTREDWNDMERRIAIHICHPGRVPGSHVYRNGTHSMPRVEFHSEPYELQGFDTSDIVISSLLSGYVKEFHQYHLSPQRRLESICCKCMLPTVKCKEPDISSITIIYNLVYNLSKRFAREVFDHFNRNFVANFTTHSHYVHPTSTHTQKLC